MSDFNHKKLLTEIIKKQMVILGPSISLYKARNVKGLTVADDGTVLQASSDPHELVTKLVNEYVALSGLILEKSIESLLANYNFARKSDLSTEPNNINQATVIGSKRTGDKLETLTKT